MDAGLVYLSNPAEGARVSDYVAPASRAKPAHNFKQLMHPEINLIEQLRNAHDPSRIAFFLRMLEVDPDSNGVLSAEEINRDNFTEFLDKEKTVCEKNLLIGLTGNGEKIFPIKQITFSFEYISYKTNYFFI
jgi:hypothetical protein